tara:strand:- start:186 stop:728 length:543 start_codon:yes stop_codon:yes gene_type:complete
VRNLKAVYQFIAITLICFSSSILAEEKIVVFDASTAIMASKPAQAQIKGALERSDIVALKAKIEGLAADLQGLEKEAESKRLTWSKEDLAEHNKKREYARADYELAGRKYQAETQQIQQAIVQEFQPKTEAALKLVIEAEKITLVLRREAIIHFSPKLDITAKVVDLMNKVAPVEDSSAP